MKNLLALAALGVLIFLGLGWYLGWYNVHTAPTPDGHTHIEVDLNTNKIKTDVGKGEEKLHDILTPAQQQGTPPQTNATPTSYRTGDDGSIIFSGSGGTPPSGNAPLPPPR